MAEQNDFWILEQALEQIDPDLVDKWGDPNNHPETQFSLEEQQALLEAGREMFLTHLTREGFPMVTVHVYVLRYGTLWSTSVRRRQGRSTCGCSRMASGWRTRTSRRRPRSDRSPRCR